MGPPPDGLEDRAKKVLENLRAARAASN
jgi:hypothetical protein